RRSMYPPLPQKSVCMSMTTSAVLARSSTPSNGQGYGVDATWVIGQPSRSRVFASDERSFPVDGFARVSRRYGTDGNANQFFVLPHTNATNINVREIGTTPAAE